MPTFQCLNGFFSHRPLRSDDTWLVAMGFNALTGIFYIPTLRRPARPATSEAERFNALTGSDVLLLNQLHSAVTAGRFGSHPFLFQRQSQYLKSLFRPAARAGKRHPKCPSRR